jgi:hypothetical protein
MTATLWIDDKHTLELGTMPGLYQAVGQFRHAAGETFFEDWPCLSELLIRVELQEAAEPQWLEDLAIEASDFRHRHGRLLSVDALRILGRLSV